MRLDPTQVPLNFSQFFSLWARSLHNHCCGRQQEVHTGGFVVSLFMQFVALAFHTSILDSVRKCKA